MPAFSAQILTQAAQHSSSSAPAPPPQRRRFSGANHLPVFGACSAPSFALVKTVSPALDVWPALLYYWKQRDWFTLMPMSSAKPIPTLTVSCPQCHSRKIIKKGTRATRHEWRQRYACTACGHAFINQVTKYSPYPVKVIMEAIGRYNLGYSAGDTVRYLKRTGDGRVGLSTCIMSRVP